MNTSDYRALCQRMNLDPIAGLRDTPAPKEKYGRRKKEVDGIIFDSTAEARAYVQLKAMRDAGEIEDLVLQPRFLLQDGFRDLTGKWHRKIEYVADFSYDRLPDHVRVVVDVKGVKVPVFLLKEKLFRKRYPDVLLELWGTKR